MKKFTIKDKVDENVCDLSLNQLSEIPVGEIVRPNRILSRYSYLQLYFVLAKIQKNYDIGYF